MPQDLSALVAQIYSKRVITRLDQINVMLRLVNRDYEGEIKDVGDTVWVRTFGNVSMSNYNRNGVINYGDLAPTKESLQVKTARVFAFSVDELDQVQNDIKALDGYAERGAVAINNDVEAKCLSVYPLANTANQIDGSGTAGAASAGQSTTVLQITGLNAYTTILLAGQCLDQQNAPTEGRWMVVGPSFKAQLLQDSKYFIRATEMGDMIVRSGRLDSPANKTPGFLGQASDFDVYASNALPNNGTGAFAIYGAGPVISYAGQLRKIQRITRESTFADAIRGLLLHDTAVFSEHAKGLGTIMYTTSGSATIIP